MLNDWNKVNVLEGNFSGKSICDVKTCKSISKFMVFNDDGNTKMSRLCFCSCSKHLSVAIRKAWKENRDRKEKLNNK
jgi:hypothetical protein